MNKTMICLAVLVAVSSYMVVSLRVFSTTPENTKAFPNCSYFSSPFDITSPEDAVMFSSDILIGAYSNILKSLHKATPIDLAPSGGFYAIYGIESGNFQAKQIPVKNFPEGVNFQPLGIHLRDSAHIHLINRAFNKGGERIETYLISQNLETKEISLEFLHASTLPEDYIGITNDLIFLSPERFIVSTSQPFGFQPDGQQQLWKKVLSTLFQVSSLKTTYFWDCGYKQEEVAVCKKVPGSEGIMNNSIAYDGQETILASDSLGRNVKVFKLQSDKSLLLTQTLDVSMLADNIAYFPKKDQFIIGGMNSPFEFAGFSSKLDLIQGNKSSKSVHPNQSLIDAISLNKTTGKYEASTLFASSNTIVGLSGALIDDSERYLFITSFIDKSLVICKKE